MKLSSRLKRALGLNPLAIRLAGLYFRPAGLSGRSRDYRRFVIAGYERGGSTMLTSALARHPEAHCYSELFNAARPMFSTPGYPKQNAWLKVIRDHSPKDFLNRFVFRGYRPEIRAVGFKIFPPHAQSPRFAGIFDGLLADPEVAFIHLTRRNKLAVFLSMVQARRTGVWAVPKGETQEQPPVTLNAVECADTFRELEQRERFFTERLAGRDHLAICYEDLVADQTVFNRVQDHLGLTRQPMRPGTGKQRTRTLRESIANFDALKAHFADGPWASFFDGAS